MGSERHADGAPQPGGDGHPAETKPPANKAENQTTLTHRVVEVLDEYLAKLQDGQPPSREELMAAHPELADQLEACLAGIDFIQATSEAAEGRDSLPRLANFRLLREVGRGGMGAVYEATQVSLGRRVALKVLRFGAVSDPAAIQRFQREAETVANLHHTNIVPIYSFGREDGINYYAMQFIDGRSLDIVLKQAERPLDENQVAAWALQAAEALDHAHRRHVVHRDVKPSNLILDEEGRVWLTDFGLAKRLDDVTLSMTGALLGTPRYMSPEQAAASQKEIDHRSDIYSLGATLYELLTGNPVFEGESHHAIIAKILQQEPVSPRRFRPEMHRDLETILLKCLSKDARKRYENAEQLAEDLRAFLQNRPIAARRAGILELSTRWLQRNRINAIKTAATVGVTACVLLASTIGWQTYRESRLATVSLDSDDPLIAEIEDRSGAVQTVTLPTQDPVEIQSGDLQLRLSGAGRLTHNYQIEASAGQQLRFQIPADANHAVKMTDVHQFKLLACADGVDAILWQDNMICRYDPATRATLWAINLLDDSVDSPVTRAVVQETDDGLFMLGEIEQSRLFDSHSSGVVNRAVDVNSDGEADVVLAFRRPARVLTLSGADGTTLWETSPEAASLADVEQRTDNREAQQQHSTIFAQPVVLGDIDSDGIEDMLITYGTLTLIAEGRRSEGENLHNDETRRWVEAVSGSNGTTLWQCELPDAAFRLPDNDKIPYAFRWFAAGKPSLFGSGSSGMMRRGDVIFRSLRREYQSHGVTAYAPDRPFLLTKLSHDGAELIGTETAAGLTGLIGIHAGSHLISIDVGTGEIVTDIDTKTVSIQPAEWQHLDGDGVADVVLTERISGRELRCSAWSVVKGEMLWNRTIKARLAKFPHRPQLSATWPRLVDLDKDGRAEVILPSDSSDMTQSSDARIPWGDLTVLNGSDGSEIWNRKLLAMYQQINHFAVGPDLDGDGVRDLFAAILWGENYDIYIDALSGADGRRLWWTRQPIPAGPAKQAMYRLGPLRWWHASADGWPKIVVPVHDDNTQSPSKFCVVSCLDGQLAHTLLDVTYVIPANGNRDGIQDLFTFRQVDGPESEPNGELQFLAGCTERWRRLAGLDWWLIPDVNDDGVRDLVSQSTEARYRAISGLDGKVLWRRQGENLNAINFADIRDQADENTVAREQPSDLNGDGVPDLLAWRKVGGRSLTKPVHAISGKSGRKLWTANIRVKVLQAMPVLEIRDLDRDAVPEVVLVAAMDWGYERAGNYATNDQQLWLAVLNGHSGQVIWKQALSPAYGHTSDMPRIPDPDQFRQLPINCPSVDLDDDGVADLVVPAKVPGESPGLEFRAYAGASGQLLWRLPLAAGAHSPDWSELSRLQVADLDRDGKPELLAMVWDDVPSGTSGRQERQARLLAIGRDGQLIWQWRTVPMQMFQRYVNEPLDQRGPVVIHGKTLDPLVCTPFSTIDGKLVLLNAAGQPVVQLPVDPHNGCRVWSVDANHDGVDEIILSNAKDIRALRADKPDVLLWKFELPTFDQRNAPRVVGLHRNGDIRPPVILLRTGPVNNSISGIDLQTGREVWRCLGPNPRNRFGQIRVETLELLSDDDTLPQQIFFHSGHVAQCRQATNASGTAEKSSQRIVPAKTLATLQPRPDDPRLRRQLPWNHHVARILKDVSAFWMWGLLYCVTLLVLPVGYFLSLWRRRWHIRQFALLPVVVGLFLFGLLTVGPRPFQFTNAQKFMLAVGYMPAFVFVLWQTYLLLTRQWKRVGFWLGLTMGISLGLAVIFLWIDQRGLWLPGEEYTLSGWYWILIAGAYLTGFAMLCMVPRMLRAGRILIESIGNQLAGLPANQRV